MNSGNVLYTQKSNLNSLYNEMKTIEEITSIIYLENNLRKINTLEETEIIKAVSSKYLLNDVIVGQNDTMYRLLPSVTDLDSNDQQHRPGDSRNFDTQQDLTKMSEKRRKA